MEFMEAVRERRSVRVFKKKAVPQEILMEILEAGRLAPAGCNLQPCHFGVIKDQFTKTQLMRVAGYQTWVATAPVVIAYCVELPTDFAEMADSDLRLSVAKTRFGAELIDYLNKFPDREAVGALLQNGAPLLPGAQISLAAANHGLRTCWVGYLDIRKANAILKLPKNMACLYLMVLGYPAETPHPLDRRPLSDLIFTNTWTK